MGENSNLCKETKTFIFSSFIIILSCWLTFPAIIPPSQKHPKNSGKSEEIVPIIKFANRNKIKLIGIVSKKNSFLYKASDIKLLIPNVKEAAGIVPTASTTSQLALGDALCIATMKYKKFGKLDFKKLHPAGSLGAQLKTVEDIMLTGSKIPFVNEHIKTQKALKILSQ